METPVEHPLPHLPEHPQKPRISATLRLEKGHDIDAACGQLRLKQETAEGIITTAATMDHRAPPVSARAHRPPARP